MLIWVLSVPSVMGFASQQEDRSKVMIYIVLVGGHCKMVKMSDGLIV